MPGIRPHRGRVPEGRQTLRLSGNDFLPSLRDLTFIPTSPGIEMPGYFQNVPAGRGIFVCAKIQMRPNNGLYFREAWALRFWTTEWRQL